MAPYRQADRILVLDGHDGAGKSSLCALLAKRHGGHVVKPFKDTLGDLIGWLWGKGHFERAEMVALAAIERELALAPPEGPLFFDRHWLSLFTVLPEGHFPNWEPRPPTLLCWVDLPSTLSRLTARGEDPGDVAEHEHYLEKYAMLARRFAVPILDTTGTTVEQAADLAEALLPGL